MLSVLICFQHTTTIIRVNPSKNNSTESQNLPAIPQITPTINSIFPSTAKAQPPKRVYPLYLWPRSKVWMRALKASIQTAATKVTNIGVRLSSGASPLPAANSYFCNTFVIHSYPTCKEK